MAMIVKHNLQAMNSNRMLGVNMSSQAKSTEKLSSGYKINRAADDAAGLSISEKMRKQIRGLTQASLNAQDGISAVQTAEGALNEVQDMLQRMNELAVKAANGTNSEDDRGYIQDEIDQLVTEIDRVAETTKFNETYLLKGADKTATLQTATAATIVTGLTATIAAGTIAEQDVVVGKVSYQASASAGDAAADNGAISGVSFDDNKISDTAMGTYAYTANKIDSDGDGTGDTDAWTFGGQDYTAAQLADLGINVSSTFASSFAVEKNFTATSTDKLPTGVALTDTMTQAHMNALTVGDLKATIKVTSDTAATIGAYDAEFIPDALSFDLHVGADATLNNKIGLEIESMSAKSLGVSGLKVDGKDSTNADAAIDVIGAAIQKISTQRSALGAVQNRLEHTINNLDNVVENTTSAEAQIRDTDMATEMVKYSNNQILAQAGQAMLAQANQANQGVLSLLQ